MRLRTTSLLFIFKQSEQFENFYIRGESAMNITVLGCGLVGGPIAMDLAAEANYNVKVADINVEALNRLQSRARVETVQANLSDPAQIKKVIAGSDMVVSAVPGHMGFQTLKAILESGKNVVDIAFFPEDPFLLDDLAKAKGVTAIVDCGVMPGMGSILVAHAASELDETDEAIIYVGGLPVVREWPYEYKAVFSPIDVLAEYIRPARYIEFGHLVTKPALSDPELIDFPGIGTLEAFNTDGLRTMLKTIPAKNMKEKTMRYPGHIEKIAILRETGFFSEEEVEVNGVRLSPLAMTARILFDKWKLGEGEADITIMRVIVRGTKDGQKKTYRWDLVDHYDAKNGIPSMARTTGYTATAAVRMLEAGLYQQKGISAPEFLGKRPECVSYLLEQLARHNVHYRPEHS
ncbi:MAG: saccharopine dehydrogenase family protein [Candidatus Villigracilaceae bacterium]